MPRTLTRFGLDVRTVGLFTTMSVGLVANFAATVAGWVPLPVAVMVSVLLLNCSFTVWHEAVHGTIANRRSLNDAIGFVAAWLAMIPFFMIREIHWLHHRFTNDPARDPDYWFIDGPFWRLPLRYPEGIKRMRQMYRSVPNHRRRQLFDRLGQLAIAALFFAAWRVGVLTELVLVWLLPKVISMFVHAWYVNYLPHHGCDAERYTSTRVIDVGWLQPLMLFHNYHGLHHAFPTVPWHRYEDAFAEKQAFLVSQGVPIVSIARIDRTTRPPATEAKSAR
jgi:ring-1,2-phenylacetyl-CoA epoxidase subunit PaaE